MQAAVQQIDAFVSSGWSHRSACLFVEISYVYYQRRKKVVTKVDSIHEEKEFLSYNTTGSCRKVLQDHKSMLTEIKPFLF